MIKNPPSPGACLREAPPCGTKAGEGIKRRGINLRPHPRPLLPPSRGKGIGGS